MFFDISNLWRQAKILKLHLICVRVRVCVRLCARVRVRVHVRVCVRVRFGRKP